MLDTCINCNDGEQVREPINIQYIYKKIEIKDRWIDGENTHSFEAYWKSNKCEVHVSGRYDSVTSDAEIRRIDATPQQEGCGKEFYKRLEEFLVSKGVVLIYLYSVRRSVTFWKKMGFMPYECSEEDFTWGNMYKKV